MISMVGSVEDVCVAFFVRDGRWKCTRGDEADWEGDGSVMMIRISFPFAGIRSRFALGKGSAGCPTIMYV